jgi:hypothetical protein
MATEDEGQVEDSKQIPNVSLMICDFFLLQTIAVATVQVRTMDFFATAAVALGFAVRCDVIHVKATVQIGSFFTIPLFGFSDC